MNSFKNILKKRKNLVLFLLPILLAIVLFATLIKTRADLPRLEKTVANYTYKVLDVQPVNFIPRTRAYGTLQPDKVWQAVAQVEGTIVYIHPGLRSGTLVKKGELLLKIDPTPYQLTYQQLQADHRRIGSEINQLEQQIFNDRELLQLEQQQLTLVERSFRRNQQLYKEQVIAEIRIDSEESSVLKQKLQIQKLNNNIRITSAKIQTLRATQSASLAAMKKAQLNISYCQIRAPFQATLANVNLQQNQYIAPRQKLFEAYGRETMKVDAQVTLKKLKQILGEEPYQQFNQLLNRPGQITKISHLLKATLHISNSEKHWPVEVISVREMADESTRTLSLTMLLEQTSDLSLIKGTYVEIDLEGPLKKHVFLVPTQAVKQGTVYVLDEQQRLKSQAIQSGLKHQEFIEVIEGLSGGEQLLTTIPNPVIEGLSVTPVPATAILQKLKQLSQPSQPS